MLKAERTTNIKEIYLGMTDPDIWDRIRFDGQDLSEFYPKEGLYYTVKNKNEVIGLALFEPIRPELVKYHPMVFKEHRRHSDEFHRLVIDKLFTDFGKREIVAEFPSCFRDIRLVMGRSGFKEMCRLKNAAKRDGKVCDLIVAQYGV